MSKTKVLSIRLDLESYDKLRNNSILANRSMRDYLMQIIANHNKPVVQKKKVSFETKAIIAEVNRIGNNINQIAHQLNVANKKGEMSKTDYADINSKLSIMNNVLTELLKYVN